MKRFDIVSGLVPLLMAVVAGVALAEEPAPEGQHPPVVDPAQSVVSTEAWDRLYEGSRLKLRDGHFADAAGELTSLAASAPDKGRKRLGLEQSWLAIYWSKRGYQLELLSPEDLAANRARFADRRTTDELALLYSSALFYGVGSGVALLSFTEPASAAAGILPLLGLSAAAVTLVYQVDKKPLRYGGAQAITSGLYLGFEEGLAWVLWRQSQTNSEDLSAKASSLILWSTSTVGAVAGGLIGQLHGVTPGRAALIGSGAFWSAMSVGFGVGALTNAPDKALLTAAAALNLGALGAVFAGDAVQPSIARVRFVDLGGLSGALVLGGLYAALADKSTDGRGALGAASVGMVAGLGTAWILTASMAPDDPLRSPVATIVPTIMRIPDTGGVLIGMAGAL